MGLRRPLLGQIMASDSHRLTDDEWARYTAQYSDHETVSGPGSTLDFTRPLRNWLPHVLTHHRINNILDLGCGDFNWLSTIDLSRISYTGWDHQTDIINANSCRYRDHHFAAVNITTVDFVPAFDLIIARDVLIHLPTPLALNVLQKIRRSHSRYLLASNFPGADNNPPNPHDLNGFYYRPTDLEAAPFNMTRRIDAVNEPGREPGREMVLFKL